MFGDFVRFYRRKEELDTILSENRWSTREEFIQLTKEYGRVSELLELKKQYDFLEKRIGDNNLLLEECKDDPEMEVMIREDLISEEQKKETLGKKIIQNLLPPDENDGRPVIVEIRAGTGGEEASLFAGELFRMYQRFTEAKEIRLEVLSSSATGLGGIKEIIFGVSGAFAWKSFKYEAGTHRVQRVPVTESSGRIHTSAVTVAVLAEPEEVEIDINPKDLRIDTFRSSGPGGQSVNTMDSAIRVTHLPTGLVVSCQDEKSQLKNKQKALRILRARLLEIRQNEENAKRSLNRRLQVGSGDRSEKIRTYNFPQNRVTDHRINLTLYNLSEVLNGRMDDLVLSLAEAEYKQQLENARDF